LVAVVQQVVQDIAVADVLCQFVVQEQWDMAVLPQVVAAWAANVGPRLGTLTAVNVLVQTLTATLADANSSKVLILPAHQAVVVVTVVFLAHVVVGTAFANAIIG
jgi:hypothetical protein